MKKKLSMLLITLALMLTFSMTCFAKSSPSSDIINPSENESDHKPSKSPQTGIDISAAFIVIIAASGIALVSKKKYSEAN